jgi:hypothetical protein
MNLAKDGSPANVNSIRYLSNKNGMVIGGNFSSIGPTICPSVCYLDPTTLQWNPLGNGLDGEVFDIQWVDVSKSNSDEGRNPPVLLFELLQY